MKISYDWLQDYLPGEATLPGRADTPEKLGEILTQVGLELETLYLYENVKGSFEGLVVGEVISCEQHPGADKLKIVMVNIGMGLILQIVCGASNVEAGKKVVLAPVGTTIYPKNGEAVTIKRAKIRGQESLGMICAEDEIGVGEDHSGIVILPDDQVPGSPISQYYNLYSDWILEIGLTPNRIDAMSHLGVAKDVCAYVAHQHHASVRPKSPYREDFKIDNTDLAMDVQIEKPGICQRYAGISISGISVKPSPSWLQNRLQSIGVRPVNNVVDITNFILHESGQPLHVFDADRITQKKIVIKNLPSKTSFVTLDGKERLLSDEDIMICDGDETPMCFGGVFGGTDSGVTNDTTNIFIESAWFKPSIIRRTSLRHKLRTEAAIRFEKGVDISKTVTVLKRAALLMREIAGGDFSSEIVDIYPHPKPPVEVILKFDYLEKLSGKKYQPEAVNNILESLNFSILDKTPEELTIAVPLSNPDVTLPADVVEEIMRIDGLDNIEIPSSIRISPAIETSIFEITLKEKMAGWLTGNGFFEIFTNSITNSKYFDEDTLVSAVRIINSLSEDLDVLRPGMIPTGLESIAYNLNRKNQNLQLFEFGKKYATNSIGIYKEREVLSIYFTGNNHSDSWNSKSKKMDVYFVKGICESILSIAGLENVRYDEGNVKELANSFNALLNGSILATGGNISRDMLSEFGIRQPVLYLEVELQSVLQQVNHRKIVFSEIPKYPEVHRDLSIIVDRDISYKSVEETIHSVQLQKLCGVRLFDVFVSDKLGEGKKSFAISFTFYDTEKTLTDAEVDLMMMQISEALQSDKSIEIRGAN